MNLNITTRRQEGKEGRREGEREKGSFRTPWKASDDESNAVDQTLARKGERKRETERHDAHQTEVEQSLAVCGGGSGRVVRGWRVKGRDVLGPVDTAESPES